jgi:chaperonin GroEL
MASKTAISGTLRTSAPEVVDSAGIIARRTIAIPGQYQNMGAMLLRHVVWTMHESTGDGGATAAVVAAHLATTASRYVDAGGDATGVLRGIRSAAASSLRTLEAMSRRVDHPRDIAAVVRGAVGEDDIALLIAEALDAAGHDGALLVRHSLSGVTECEYAAGAIWDSGPLSSYLLREAQLSVDTPSIVVTDFDLGASDVIAVLETCLAADQRSLLIITPGLSSQAISLLVSNRDRGILSEVHAVKGPATHGQEHQSLEDIAVIVGARLFSKARGDALRDATFKDFGRARHVWATRTTTGIVGGKGAVPAIQRRLAEAAGELRDADTDDAQETIRKRIGRLASLTVTLRAGGRTERERDEREERIRSGLAAGRAAMTSGVVPGGGSALLAAARVIDMSVLVGDELAGARIFARSLEGPIRTIAANAGHRAPLLSDDTLHLDTAWCRTFDVLSRSWVNPWDAGIIDSFHISQRVIELATSFAETVLRTDTLVHRNEPEISLKP